MFKNVLHQPVSDPHTRYAALACAALIGAAQTIGFALLLLPSVEPPGAVRSPAPLDKSIVCVEIEHVPEARSR